MKFDIKNRIFRGKIDVDAPQNKIETTIFLVTTNHMRTPYDTTSEFANSQYWNFDHG